MTPVIQTILSDLKKRFTCLYGERLDRLVLYGSQARGDADEDSDIDVLVVLKGKIDRERENNKTRKIVERYSNRHNKTLSLFYLPPSRFYREQGPFLRNIRREGITLCAYSDKPMPACDTVVRRKGMLTKAEKELLELAKENLEIARLLQQQKFYRASVSRAYYSLFYTVQALLERKGLAFSKHASTLAGFKNQYIDTGLVPKEYHQYLEKAKKARQDSDYSREAKIKDRNAEQVIGWAESFLEIALKILNNKWEWWATQTTLLAHPTGTTRLQNQYKQKACALS